MRKRMLSMLLCLLLVFTLCPMQADAQWSCTDLGTLRVTYNGDVYTAHGWQDAAGHVYLPGKAAEQLLGRELSGAAIDGKKYVDMTAATDSCVYDQTLDALYIWNGLPEEPELSSLLYPELGDPSDQPVSYQEFFAMLDTAVALADPDKLAQWQQMLPEARSSRQIMTRAEGMFALLYAAVTLGGEYSEFNTDWVPLNEKIGEKCWDEIASIYKGHDPHALIPNPYPYNLGGFQEASYVYDGWDMEGVAYRYSFGRCSILTGETLFDYDSERNSMRLADDFTKREAVNALSRFLDSAPEKAAAYMVPWDDPQVTQYDATCLTPEILAAAGEMSDLTGESPPLWNGAVVGGDYEQTAIDVEQFALDARKLSEYGFNCARYMITYELLFDRNVEHANLLNLRKLDALVAWAARYRIHLNLTTITVPGRWAVTNNDTFTSNGEFDLFTNPDRQKEAQRMWSLLAERYKDVPSSVLSFQPIWECSNGSLSTGLPFPPYTYEDVAAAYADLTQTIRNCDPDRFILYEPTASNDWETTIREGTAVQTAMERFDNVQLLTNFCEMPYVYAEMTAVEGENIDANNHAMFKPGYPTTYYGVQNNILPEAPLTLCGGIPAGTTIDLYASEVQGSGTLMITADGETLYSESLTDAVYQTENPLSRYFLYAKSERKISIVLENTANVVQIAFDGTQLNWSGMDICLPESYAVERWWYPSAYDQFQEGGTGPLVIEKRLTSNIQLSPNCDVHGEVTIHADTVSYTTPQIVAQSNRNTINAWGQAISQFAPGSATRIERAAFYLGTEYTSALDYYKDVLEMCGTYGLGWFTNDYCFHEMFKPYYEAGSSPYAYVGAAYCQCADGMVLKEMLQLYQNHMLAAAALPEADEEVILAVDNSWTVGAEENVVAGNVAYYRNGAAQIFCAFYDESGKLLSVCAQNVLQGEQSFAFRGPAESESAACFLLDSNFAPLCPSAVINGA